MPYRPAVIAALAATQPAAVAEYDRVMALLQEQIKETLALRAEVSEWMNHPLLCAQRSAERDLWDDRLTVGT